MAEADRRTKAGRDAVVVTGTGLVCALGGDAETAWSAAAHGDSGIGPMQSLEHDDGTVRAGGEYPGIEHDCEPREIVLLQQALDEAWKQATMGHRIDVPPDRRAVVLGTTLAGMRRAARFFRGANPSVMQTFLAGPIASALARRIDATGPCVSVSAACASGLSSIGHGLCLLNAGAADLVVAGGYDPISEYAYGGFRSLRLVAEDGIRPFMRERKGMQLGEGYGVVILERHSDARSRNAPITATIAGIGESSDGYHLTQPHPDGDGLTRAITDALRMAAIDSDNIDLISLHGTGTPANDAAEFTSLNRVFGDALTNRRAVAHKAACGHTLGGAGAVELILTLRALHADLAPPTANAQRSELEFPLLPIVAEQPEPRPLRRSLSISLGFGGSNAAVVLDREVVPNPPTPELRAPVGTSDVVITGAGSFGPYAAIERWWLSNSASSGEDECEINDADLSERAGGRRARRMSVFAKLLLAAAREAISNFDSDDWDDFSRTSSVLVGTAHGASGYSEDYYRQLVAQGIDSANPWWFAEGVPNVGSAHLSMELGVQATAQTVLGSRTAGLDALVLAWMRIRGGYWPGALVAGADEQTDLCSSIYADAGLHCSSKRPRRVHRGFTSAPLAASIVLEPDRPDIPRKRQAVISHAGMRRAEPTPTSMARAVDRLLADLGDPPAVITSGNRTWLDLGESRGVARAIRRTGRTMSWAPGYRNRSDGFGAGGLLSLVGWLATGRLPGTPNAMASGGDATIEDAAILTSGYDGAVCGVRLRRLPSSGGSP